MRSAPEMVPSLDDALLALDGFPGRVPDIGLAVRFLEQLNGVRDVPAVLPDQHQAAVLEGAYQAGFRCADESGHVLVVSLPDLLAHLRDVEHAGRLARLEAGWLASFGRFARWVGRSGPLGFVSAACAVSSLAALTFDHDVHAAAWLAFGALGWGLLAARSRVWPGSCSCGQYQHADLEQHEPECTRQALAPRCSYPECFCNFEKMVAGCQTRLTK